MNSEACVDELASRPHDRPSGDLDDALDSQGVHLTVAVNEKYGAVAWRLKLHPPWLREARGLRLFYPKKVLMRLVRG